MDIFQKARKTGLIAIGELPKGKRSSNGGKARAKALTAEKRRKIAQKAAKARWEKKKD